MGDEGHTARRKSGPTIGATTENQGKVFCVGQFFDTSRLDGSQPAKGRSCWEACTVAPDSMVVRHSSTMHRCLAARILPNNEALRALTSGYAHTRLTDDQAGWISLRRKAVLVLAVFLWPA